MMDALGLLLIGALTVGPLLLREWHDRRRNLALAVRARAHRAVLQALGGESYLTVSADPPAPWRRGRVVLSAPAGFEWLIECSAGDVLAVLPADWELVVPRRSEVQGAPGRPRAAGAPA
jgi:hypothetical protein